MIVNPKSGHTFNNCIGKLCLYRQVIAPLLFWTPIKVTLMNDNPGCVH